MRLFDRNVQVARVLARTQLRKFPFAKIPGTGKEAEILKFEAVRGLEGVKEASFNLDGVDLKVAVTSGMANAKPLLEQIKNGTSPYAFIEVMCCPGGCINGGGQPYIKPQYLPNEDIDIDL